MIIEGSWKDLVKRSLTVLTWSGLSSEAMRSIEN